MFLDSSWTLPGTAFREIRVDGDKQRRIKYAAKKSKTLCFSLLFIFVLKLCAQRLHDGEWGSDFCNSNVNAKLQVASHDWVKVHVPALLLITFVLFIITSLFIYYEGIYLINY